MDANPRNERCNPRLMEKRLITMDRAMADEPEKETRAPAYGKRRGPERQGEHGQDQEDECRPFERCLTGRPAGRGLVRRVEFGETALQGRDAHKAPPLKTQQR